jgi:hypothetical protein
MSFQRPAPVKAAALCSLALLAFVALPASPAAGAATRAEFAAQAEPICAGASTQVRSQSKKARKSAKRGHDKAAGKAIMRMGRAWSNSVSRVRQIAPPPGEEATVSQWLNLTSQIGTSFSRMGRAHKQGKIGLRNSIYFDMQEIGTEAITLMRDWGFSACIGEQLPALGPLPSGR